MQPTGLAATSAQPSFWRSQISVPGVDTASAGPSPYIICYRRHRTETAMTRTIEVEIDSAGSIQAVDPVLPLPEGRALLILEIGPNETMLLSEAALAVNWLSPEEDEAWSDFQTVRDSSWISPCI